MRQIRKERQEEIRRQVATLRKQRKLERTKHLQRVRAVANERKRARKRTKVLSKRLKDADITMNKGLFMEAAGEIKKLRSMGTKLEKPHVPRRKLPKLPLSQISSKVATRWKLTAQDESEDGKGISNASPEKANQNNGKGPKKKKTKKKKRRRKKKSNQSRGLHETPPLDQGALASLSLLSHSEDSALFGFPPLGEPPSPSESPFDVVAWGDESTFWNQHHERAAEPPLPAYSASVPSLPQLS